MWILMTRTPRPDAAYWPGRRALAALDAVLWPLAIAGTLAHTGFLRGIVGAVGATWLAFAACGRLRTAWQANHRYRFTTWRWGRLAGGLMVFGILLKLMTELQRLA